MKFVFESDDINDYLKPDKYVDFYNRSLQRKSEELFSPLSDEMDKSKVALEFVREEIRHSSDIDSEHVIQGSFKKHKNHRKSNKMFQNSIQYSLISQASRRVRPKIPLLRRHRHWPA